MGTKLVPGNHPALKTICSPVQPGEHLPFLDDMKRACTKGSNGVGLAAPQIGITKRVIFIMVANKKGVIAGEWMINPEIITKSEETNLDSEGCLSYPGIYKNIRRHNWIKVKYEDLKRRPREEVIEGFRARVIQHEVDHLNGECKVGDPDFTGESTPIQPARNSINRQIISAALATACTQ